MPTWLGASQVMATTARPTSKIPNSCHSTARHDSTNRGQPTVPAGRALVRGPVIQPVKKLSSFQPQAKSAQVNAQYAPATPVCCAVCAKPTSAAKPSKDDKTRLRRIALRDMRLSKITMPVLNHQIKTAKPMAMELSVIAGMAVRCLGR